MPFNLGTTLKSGLNSFNAANQFRMGGSPDNLWASQQQWQQQQNPQPSQFSNPSFWGNALSGSVNQFPQLPQGTAPWMQGLMPQGTQGNPYAAQNMAGNQGSTNTPTLSAQNMGQGVSQGAGGTPVLGSTPSFGYEQFFQGGGVPQQQFNLNQQETEAADKKANPALSGWKWAADKGLGALESLAPIAGGILGTLGGPVGSVAGGLAGQGVSKLSGWGREALRG